MKKSLILLTVLGTSLLLTPTARADYSFSISYGYPNLYKSRNACSYNPGRGITCGPSRRIVRLPHPRLYKKRCHRLRWRHPRTRVIYVNTDTPVVKETRIVTTQEKFGISDVIILSKAGVSDTVIIEKIRKTGSVFDLSVEEIEALRREGVSRRVINHMLETAR